MRKIIKEKQICAGLVAVARARKPKPSQKRVQRKSGKRNNRLCSSGIKRR
jgi:hypothetical protein